ncbi:uncharacterized protein LOC133815543 [Humulus lupulus]|uniref:uncharacterized protein LOC133815543 n=1 Tax=Humulus lupulus TaxID=3486 RepID=UPI002B409D11|nr:uncharacterized protein LOC133815543 [Humulus lupulus]
MAMRLLLLSIELDRFALYLDSDIIPWHSDKPWEDLLPSEWVQVFRYGTKEGKPSDRIVKQHTYILEPITGNEKYTKLRANELAKSDQPLQNATVNLDDVILCLSKDGYKDMLKLADHFSAINQRLKYAHFCPHVSMKSDPRSWWKYAYRAVSNQVKKGRFIVGLDDLTFVCDKSNILRTSVSHASASTKCLNVKDNKLFVFSFI